MGERDRRYISWNVLRTGTKIAGIVLPLTIAGAGCAPAAQLQENRVVVNNSGAWDPFLGGWTANLEKQGKRVEADMAEVGINNNGWYDLIPFGTLTPEDREKLGMELPESGYFALKKGETGVNLTFLIAIRQKNDTDRMVSLTVPAGKVMGTSTTDGSVPQIKPTFDLAKFITFTAGRDRNGFVINGEFAITKHDDPITYLTAPGALTGIELRANSEYISQLPRVTPAVIQ